MVNYSYTVLPQGYTDWFLISGYCTFGHFNEPLKQIAAQTCVIINTSVVHVAFNSILKGITTHV
jgi:hypothetical protein